MPEAVAVNLRGRSFTIAAAVEIHDDAPSGTLMSFGGLLGGLILYLRGGELCFTYSWLGEDIQTVRGAARLDHGRHLLTAEFAVAGRDTATPSPVGTLTLFVDQTQIGQGALKTQPGKFGLGGAGLSVGHATAPAADPGVQAPFPFTGGRLEAIVVDVSGDGYLDHEAEVRSYLSRD